MNKKIQIHLRIKNTPGSIWSVDGHTATYIHNQRQMAFSMFDSVFYLEKTAEIYRKTIKDAVARFNQGENLTIFAYGQTGSGKTHTILGGAEKGFIVLALEDVFPGDLEISFFELFNERIFDLFTRNELKMLTMGDKPVVVGLHIERIATLKGALEFIDLCLEQRRTGKTAFNMASSRSHAILQIRRKSAVLTFIDLAGSEKASYDEKRMKEAAFINKSLLALGTLVNNLLNNKAIGFRNSKLTRLLQDAITTKSSLVAFCMINCTSECLSESLNSLSFAARLSNVQLKAEEVKSVSKESGTSDSSLEHHRLSFAKLVKRIAVQEERIIDLEKSVLTLLENVRDRSLSDAFILEKQLYQIRLESVDEDEVLV